ncbi:MAG: hypothetical protein FWD66_03115 [Paludibacter sp.]|nr:hypothetical protein [Paludibacter sp.]
MKIFSNIQSKVFMLTFAIVIVVTFAVLDFTGNWLKSVVLFVVTLPITYFVMYFVIYAFGKKKDKTPVSKQQIWKTIVVNSIVFPIVGGLVFWLMGGGEPYYTINFQRIIIAIVLSFVVAVIGNLLFIKDFRTGNKELEN